MPRFRSKKGGVKLRTQPLAAQLAADAAGPPLKHGRRALGSGASRKRAASDGDDDAGEAAPVDAKTVSYTHLTLPTILLV